MARSDRTGNRKMRNRQEVMRVPEMGYYLVVTDTEATERCYFEGLQDSLPDEVKQKLVIKVIETKTQNLIQKCHEMVAYDAQYRIPWIVFDRDQVPNFDKIISDAEAANILVGWSNPCFEIWLYTYFGSMPTIHESWNCCKKFGELYEKRTEQKYSKSAKDLYKRLIENGEEQTAIRLAQRKYEQCIGNGYTIPSKMCPCTTVHELVQEIRRKIKKAEV